MSESAIIQLLMRELEDYEDVDHPTHIALATAIMGIEALEADLNHANAHIQTCISDWTGEVETLEKERDTYAELAAGKCVIQKVIDALGPQTLVSVEKYCTAVAALEKLQTEEKRDSASPKQHQIKGNDSERL